MSNGETSLVCEVDSKEDAIRALIQTRVTDAFDLVRRNFRMQRHLVTDAVRDGVLHSDSPLVLVVVVRWASDQGLVLVSDHVVATEYAPVQQVGRRHPDRFEEAAIERASPVSSPCKQI